MARIRRAVTLKWYNSWRCLHLVALGVPEPRIIPVPTLPTNSAQSLRPKRHVALPSIKVPSSASSMNTLKQMICRFRQHSR